MTSDPGTAFSATLEKLAVGDVVTPIEALRRETIELLLHIQQVDPTDEPEERIAAMRVKLGPYLEQAIPLADHGRERGLAGVMAEIVMLAVEVGDSLHQPSGDPLLEVALHDVVWTLVAHALTHDRADVSASLGNVEIPSRYPEDTAVVFDAIALRHNDLFARDSFKIYASLRAWLTNSELREGVPRWQRESDLDLAVEETELWAALRFSHSRETDTWVPLEGIESKAARRLRSRFKHPSQRAALVQLLGVNEDEVAGALNASYARLKRADGWSMRGQLIPTQ